MSSDEHAEASEPSEGSEDTAKSEAPESPEAAEAAGAADDGEPERDSGVAPAGAAEESLQAALDETRAERDKLKDQLLRTAADFDNFRKRARREVEDGKLRGKDEAVRDFLPVIDNLERAVQASDSATDVSSVVEGVRMVLKLFEDTAQRMGLNRVSAIGERFDPSIHDAIQQQETDEVEPGTIVAEVTPGYMFGQRLLRAAMVVVARAPDKPKSAPPSAPPPKSSAPPPKSSAPPPPKSSAPPKAKSSAPPGGPPWAESSIPPPPGRVPDTDGGEGAE